MNDINDTQDIRYFVDAFYKQVQQDDLIGPVFLSKIQSEEWPTHLKKMYSFWSTVLFHQGDYKGNPFSKHRDLPIEKEHFDQWLALFTQTIDAHFAGPRAENAKERARMMSRMFQIKLDHLKNNPQYKSIV